MGGSKRQGARAGVDCVGGGIASAECQTFGSRVVELIIAEMMANYRSQVELPSQGGAVRRGAP